MFLGFIVFFMYGLVFPWFITYFITLFLFDVSPGVSFVTTAKNTIKNKSLTIGVFTALGIATSDAISSVVGFFFCSALTKYDKAFKIIQLLGMVYLLFVGAKMFFSKAEELTMDKATLSKTKKDAYKSGFFYTASNFSIAIVITSVISQFYKYVNSWYGYTGLLITVPVVSFLTFFLIACCCYYLKIWKIFGKYGWVLDKIAGCVLVFLALCNVKDILKGLGIV